MKFVSWKLKNFQSPLSVDALIIFHHEWDALRLTAESYRRFYPTGELIIARDTLPVEKPKFLLDMNARFVASYSTTQFFLDLVHAGRDLSTVTQEEFEIKIGQDLARIKEALFYSKSEYMIFMEADSLVLDRIEVNTKFAMDSLDVNPYEASFLKLIREVSGRKFPLSGWGFVTGYVQISALKSSLEWAAQNMQVLLTLFSKDHRFLYLDHFLPILFHLAGHNVYSSGQVGECLRDSRWEKKRYKLLHQYRVKY